MSKVARLKGARTTQDLASLLGIYTAKSLTAILYAPTRDLSYRKFSIPKKKGGYREISAPNPKLKKLQRCLADLLTECWHELNKDKTNAKLKPISHGFEPERSILSNAQPHIKKKYVLNVDIEQFFPSINFGRVRGFFIKNKNFRLNKKIATIIAQIACHENSLPQGSPCSPIIANMIASTLDAKLLRFAKAHNCFYTRYADDLSFSCNEKKFPVAVAKKRFLSTDEWHASPQLEKILVSSGFQVNKKKTRLQKTTARQEVTGLLVNKKVNVAREYYKDVRSMCNMLFNKGFYYRKEHVEITKKPISMREKIFALILRKDVRAVTIKRETQMARIGTLSELEGMLNFIYEVKYNYYKRLKISNSSTVQYPLAKPIKKNPTESYQFVGAKKLYYKFIFFKFFCALDKPLIICEGETDYIYLKTCLKRFSSRYPSLVSARPSYKNPQKITFSYGLKFFEYTERISTFFKTTGGIDWMSKIITDYAANVAQYHAPNKMAYPVILLTDNDDAAKELFKKISKELKKEIDGMASFYHLTHNLYLLPIPKTNPTSSACIEMLLSTKLLEHTIEGGKTFSTKNDYDTSKHYGKVHFAKHVVQKNASPADIAGLLPIIDAIQSIMLDYAALAKLS